MRNLLLSLLCALIMPSMIVAQSSDNILSKEVNIKPGVYTLLKIIETLSVTYGVNITYNAKMLPLEDKIEIKTEETTVKEILDEIQKTLQVVYIVKDEYIILKKRTGPKVKISGVVTDSLNKELLAGTTIYIQEKKTGIISSPDGSYVFKLEPGTYTLVFTFIGYKSEIRTIDLEDDMELNITMSSTTDYIDEVKVTRQRNFWRNLDVGRSINYIDTKKIETLNANNAADILQASMPGVWSTQTSGAPGDHQKVKIRGINSIFGCTDPLYIIDGVAVPIVNLHSLGIADLNIYDIESITVLKDASSNAIYGFQGGNGVVIIDTKRGGENHISFSSKIGIQRVPFKYSLMNTKDLLSSFDSSKVNRISNTRLYYPVYSDTLSNTNWQDVVFQDGILNEYQLSYSGKAGKNSIYLSGNYYTHDGIITNSNYKRYNMTANFGRNITKKLSAELNIRSSLQKNTNNLDMYNGNDILIEGINKSPCVNSTPDSFYYWPQNINVIDQNLAQRTYYYYSVISGYPESKVPTDSILNYNINTLKVFTNAIDLRAKYSLLENLYLNIISSVTLRDHTYQSEINAGDISLRNFMRSKEHYILFNQQINLNFIKNFGKHEIQLTSGYRNYGDNAYWNLDSLANRNSNSNLYLKNSLAINGDHGSVIRQIQSYSTLFNYNFKRKYFLSLLANYEKLKVDRIIGYEAFYPSASLKWDISREYPLNLIRWLDELSIFANWGRVGNMPVNALATDFYMGIRYNYGGTYVNGRAVTQFANHYFKPEIIDEYNLGFNIGLWNKRIQITADKYYKISKNLIIIRDIPIYYGGGRIMMNIGKIINQGTEINLEMDAIYTTSFLWTMGFSISTNKLLVKKIGEEKQLMFYNNDVLIPTFEVKENEDLGVIKGYKYVGSWTSEDYKKKDIHYINMAGGKYLNYDTTNKVINENDKMVLGKTLPDYTWHWNNTFTYKNVSMEFTWYGVAGVSKFNATKASTYMSGVNRDVNQFLQKGNKILTNVIFYQSSYFIEDASFIRLKQFTIAYRIPGKIGKLAEMKVSLSMENFITITHYTGYDPEATIYTDNSFSDYAVDRGAYPNPKSIYLTLNLDF
jgi:TonB-dependent starch-binding outer membrane protein SusC